jgi:hypothetical protein
MKQIFTFLLFAAFSLGVSAQLLRPITFEGDTTGNGYWNFFANGTAGTDSADCAIVLNPDKSSINKSDSVLRFIVNANADAWAGMWTDAYGEMEFTDASHTLYVMVHKSNIAPIAFKLENSTNGGAMVMEIKVPNTLTDEWESIGIEMTPAIGFTYTRLVFFPDFPDGARTGTEGSVNYIDNIYKSSMVSVKQVSGASMVIYPNPVENRMAVQYPDMKGLTISNILGETLKSVKFQTANSKVLELSDLKTGVYFVTVETGSGTYTSKFMKK